MRRLRRDVDRLAFGTRALLRQFGGWLLPGAWRTVGALLVGSAVAAGVALTVVWRAPVLLWPASASRGSPRGAPADRRAAPRPGRACVAPRRDDRAA